MGNLIFDLETLALPDSEIDYDPEELEAPSNYKDAEKIANYATKAMKGILKKAATDPMTGRIAISGIKWEKVGYRQFTWNPENPNSEAEICKHTTDLLLEALLDGVKIVGYNLPFDQNFLLIRCLINNVEIPSAFFDDNGYPCRQFENLVRRVQFGKREFKFPGLGRLGTKMGVPKTADGGDFAAMWAGNREKALEYNRMDLDITEMLAKRLQVSEH